MDIYTSIKKETLENARARAIMALSEMVCGDIDKVLAVVDEIKELDAILKYHEERESWKSTPPQGAVLLKQE